MRHLNKQNEKSKLDASSTTPTTEQTSPGQSENPLIAPMQRGIPLSELQEAIPPSAGEAEPGRQGFIDKAAIEIYARHFQFPKCYQQATELWEARKTWLAGKWAKPVGTFAGNTRLP